MPAKKAQPKKKAAKTEPKKAEVIKAPSIEKERIEYERHSWKRVVDVFKCPKCDSFRESKPEIVNHILSHYKPAERDKVRELILEKDKENE